MEQSRWDRFTDKAFDVLCLVGLACLVLMMLGILAAGIVTAITKGL